MGRYFKKIDNIESISAWKSKGLSDESIKPPATFNNNLAPAISYIGVKARAEFDGNCLKQNKTTFTQGNIVNLYIVYEINLWDCRYDDYPVLENYLFGAVKLIKDANFGKFKYSGYGIEFDRHGTFSFLGGLAEMLNFWC